MTQRYQDREPSATLSPAALERLQTELDRLTTEGRTHIAERLLRAREFGDIRENAEYDAAKNEQGLMEARIRQLQAMLKDVRVLEGPASGDEVAEGMLVTLRPVDDDDPEDETYLLAHSKEERTRGARTITAESPLGSVLLGHAVGDRVTYAAPGGEFTYEIVSFEPSTD